MKYTSKKLQNSQVEVEGTLDHQEFLNYYQPVYDQALSHVHLKGFRPGTAPKELADKAIDKEKVFNEAATEAVRATLQEIAHSEEWQVIDQPKVEVLETNPVADVGLKFKAELTLFPEIKLGNYQKIARRVLQEGAKDDNKGVDDAEFERNMKWVLNSRAKLTRVNRDAKNGDMVDIDFSGFIDGKPLDGASGKADSFVLGEGKFIPGFEDYIVGHKEGDEFEFSIQFPADYWKEDLRNKKVDFKVALKGVYERELPELNDEFVRGLGKFENVEDFKKSVREGMKKEKEEKQKERNRLKIIDEVIKDAKIELPQVMVDRTLDGMVEEYRAYARHAGKESSEDLKEKLRERAERDVATNLVLYQIAKEQNLEPSQKEVEEEANKILAHNQMSNPSAGGQIDPQKLYDYSYGIVKNKKVFEYLESLNT